MLALTYSWNIQGADIKSLLGEDYELGEVSATTATDLFKAVTINFMNSSGKNINIVNADNAKDLYNSKALEITKADGNNGLKVDLTAYLANVTSDKPQLVNNLLVIPSAGGNNTLTGTMWLAHDSTGTNNDNDNDNDNSSNGGSGGGGGGCNSLALGIIAAGLVLVLKRR